MNRSELSILVQQVASGQVDTAAAEEQLLEALRASPYEDLGFARVDHHRALRQGFPEVVLGLGKTPAQVAAIAAEIVGRGFVARSALPTEHVLARVRGTSVVAAAGTADLPVAEEAARTAELMGNTVARVYDVGVAGLHRLLGERARLARRRGITVVPRM